MPKFPKNPSPFMKGYSYPGTSPLKQAIGGDAGEAVDHWKKYQAAKAQDAAVDKLATKKNISRKAFDTKLAKLTGTVDPHAKVSKTSKLIKGAKKVAGKAGKFLGGKALGVAGMMMATSSKADQPKKPSGQTDINWRPNIPGSKMNRK